MNSDQNKETEHPKVFISHATADKERFVIEFATRLRNNGVDAWVDQWEINPGDSLVGKIFDEALGSCHAMIVVLSQHSIASKWVREELNAAVVRKIESAIPLIPIRLDHCEVPECLKHCVWQEITDPSNYDNEFKRILNSIYGQYEKPPIGEPPSHIVADTPAFDGLAPIDGTILKTICQIAIDNEYPSVDGEPLVERLKELDITESEIMETQEVLEGRGLVEVHRTIGPPYVYSMKVTPMGFDLFARECVPDYSKICADVGRCLVRKEHMNNRSMAQALNLPLRITDHIFESFEYNGLIRYSESIGGGLHMNVYWVSPELRRELED